MIVGRKKNIRVSILEKSMEILFTFETANWQNLSFIVSSLLLIPKDVAQSGSKREGQYYQIGTFFVYFTAKLVIKQAYIFVLQSKKSQQLCFTNNQLLDVQITQLHIF